MVKQSTKALNRTFAALSDPTRRLLLRKLARGGDCVTALAKPHRMSLPAISKHLRVLETAGLIRRRRHGRIHRLRLNAAPMKQAAHWLEAYRQYWEASFDRLADYLKEMKKSDRP